MIQRRKITLVLGAWGMALAVIAVLAVGCATMAPKKPALVPTGSGTVVYLDKYEFKNPEGWALMREVEGGDFEFGFLKLEKGEFPRSF